MARRWCRVVGIVDPCLRALLADVLLDHDVAVGDDDSADLVVVLVPVGDARRAIAEARRAAGDAPIIALLPFEDDGLGASARRCGADACYTLTAPLRELEAALDAALTPEPTGS